MTIKVVIFFQVWSPGDLSTLKTLAPAMVVLLQPC